MTRLSGLIGDERGAAFVEFALILPLMLLMVFGSAAVVGALEAQRKVDHVAYAIADLVAQDRSVTSDDLSDVFIGGATLIDPMPATDLGQRIASFTADGKGNVGAPDWETTAGAYTGTHVSAPDPGFLKPYQSVIVAEATYRYTALNTMAAPVSMTFQSRALLRPRLVDRVICSDCK